MAGQGSQFSRVWIETANGGSTTPPAITAMTRIGGITSISGLEGGETPEIDVTDLDSTAAEFIAGLPDFGSVQLEINELTSDTGQGLVRTAWANSETRWFAYDLRLPGSTTQWSRRFVRGIVRAIPLSLGANEAQTRSVTIRLSGSPTTATTVTT
jgi:hypothetical protein